MLPTEFLTEIARQYVLSSEQEEAFVKRFSTNKAEAEIAEELHISHGAFRVRMAGVYKKFSISGNAPGKYAKLLSFLNDEYRKATVLGFVDSHPSHHKLDALVQEVRQKHQDKIEFQCGTIRMLDIAQPVFITDIYTDVNILEEIPSQQWRNITDLLQDFNPESNDFDRLGLGKRQQRVSGLEAVSRYTKLMVLGKPGSGKTTFLQWVAIKCNQGEFQPHLVPIFIRLKNFAEDTRTDDREYRLLNYINEDFFDCGIDDKSVLETILNQGRALILLDGLDEVSEQDEDAIVNEIRYFTEKYFKNQFIISCRIAAYQYRFQGFTDVEVADFNDLQIKTFVQKWFGAVGRNNWQNGEATASRFIYELNLPENQKIKELAVTPILLNLLCLIFQGNGKFPSRRAKLYEQGLDIMLIRWDESKGIKRDEFYRNLSLQMKIRLLSKLAKNTFMRGYYFFEKTQIERYIADYLRELDIQSEQERVTLLNWHFKSQILLQSLEAQHGLLVERARKIYSFLHLTFQEYFTAKEFACSDDEKSLITLLENITDKRWNEVFLLTASLSENADCLLLLMKQQIDVIINSDEKLRKFIDWVNQKSSSVVLSDYKPAAIRAFYFELARPFGNAPDFNFVLRINGHRTLNSKPNLPFDMEIDMLLDKAFRDNDTITVNSFLVENISRACEVVRNHGSEPELQQALQKVKEQLPGGNEDTQTFKIWWEVNGQEWTEQLKCLMIKHRNIGHDWQFNEQQRILLQQYYDANKLLFDCMDNTSNLSSEVRRKIEDTLLLPLAE